MKCTAVAPVVCVMIGCGSSTPTPSTAEPPRDGATPSVASEDEPLVTAEDGAGETRPEVIQKIVRAHFEQLEACYQDGQRRDPELRGRINTAFAIAGDGSTFDVKDKDSAFEDPEVVRCVLGVFSKMKFPATGNEESTTVVYPIMFSPDEPTEN